LIGTIADASALAGELIIKDFGCRRHGHFCGCCELSDSAGWNGARDKRRSEAEQHCCQSRDDRDDHSVVHSLSRSVSSWRAAGCRPPDCSGQTQDCTGIADERWQRS